MDNMEIFFFLRIFILTITLICGYLYSNNPSKKIYLIIPVILISLNEGLRFGRGIDYNGYYFKYNDIVNGFDIRTNDLLFTLLCKFNDYIGLPYQGLIFLMSFILIVCGVFYLRSHIKVLSFALPLFFLFTIDAENLMRWFLAFSVLLVGISYLERDNLKYYFICSGISFLFHSGIIVVVPIFLLLYYVKRPLIKPLPACIVYIVIYIFFKNSYMLNFVSYMNIFSGMEQFSGYVDNAEGWLTGTANYVAGKLKIGTVIMDLILIYIGYRLIKYEPKFTYYYNICLIGTVLSPALYQIEILYRVCLLFKLFQFLIIAYSIYHFIIKQNILSVYKILTCFLVLFLVKVYVVNILFEPYTEKSYLYIWDSMGRHFLSI